MTSETSDVKEFRRRAHQALSYSLNLEEFRNLVKEGERLGVRIKALEQRLAWLERDKAFLNHAYKARILELAEILIPGTRFMYSEVEYYWIVSYVSHDETSITVKREDGSTLPVNPLCLIPI